MMMNVEEDIIKIHQIEGDYGMRVRSQVAVAFHLRQCGSGKTPPPPVPQQQRYSEPEILQPAVVCNKIFLQ
jgi:hypothetical protein